MHAMYALAGMEALTAEVVLARLTTRIPASANTPSGWRRKCLHDVAGRSGAGSTRWPATTDIRVRYQLAFTLGETSQGAGHRSPGRHQPARRRRSLDSPGRAELFVRQGR